MVTMYSHKGSGPEGERSNVEVNSPHVHTGEDCITDTDNPERML